MKLDLSRQIFEKSNFMKIRPVRAKLFHEDRRTDMMTLIVAFRNFAIGPKICSHWKNWDTINQEEANVWKYLLFKVKKTPEDGNASSTRSITYSALSTQQTTNFTLCKEPQHSKSVITYTLRKCSNKDFLQESKSQIFTTQMYII